MKKLLFVLLLIPATLFCLQMQGQIYINFDGVEGDTKTKDKTIQVLALTIGSENASTIGSATGGAGAGKAKFDDITFTKNRGRSSTAIQQRLYSGTNIPRVVINYYKPGSVEPFMVITLSMVFVKKVALTFEGSEPPAETITLAYGAIKIEDNYGEPNKPTSSWNAVTNKMQ